MTGNFTTMKDIKLLVCVQIKLYKLLTAHYTAQKYNMEWTYSDTKKFIPQRTPSLKHMCAHSALHNNT